MASGRVDREQPGSGPSWAAAFERLVSADTETGLDPDGLERLAVSAYLLGRVDESISAWERAQRLLSQQEDAPRAARCAFWLAFVLLNNGELSRGGGWVLRAQRVLDRSKIDCVEHGYLGYLSSLRSAFAGEFDAAAAGFAAAAEVGDRFDELELVALSRVGQGRCLIRSGRATEGLALVDEAMATVAAAAVTPIATGDLYCTVIEGCLEVSDLRRAQEWTDALDRWCEGQPDLVLYRGQCLVHRAQLKLFRGEWADALHDAGLARARLSRPRTLPALGAAWYVCGELHRLRGELAEAEGAVAQAGRCGHPVQPGLAQLRLVQHRPEEAHAALCRALEAAGEDPVERSTLLSPLVETSLAVGDTASARTFSDELTRVAAHWASSVLAARALHAAGCVLLAEGEAERARSTLRSARAAWVELEAPYDAARSRLQLARAAAAMGDQLSASMDLDAARNELLRLGAAPDLVPPAVRAPSSPTPGDGLTPREVEVLRELATGKSNRAIGAALFISERTVATHVSSILRKLALPSRSAATSYAHQHHLL
jgi:DNA-binding NarL/FixJ family response regulator